MSKSAPAPIPVTRCDHIALAVPNLDDAIELLTSRYGITVGIPKEVSEQGVRIAYADLGNIHLELMEPMGADSPVQGFLHKRPLGGLHHICLSTADADQAHANFRLPVGNPLARPAPDTTDANCFFSAPRTIAGRSLKSKARMPAHELQGNHL